MPKAWFPGSRALAVRDEVPPYAFNMASDGDRWASVFEPYGHHRGRAKIVPAMSSIPHISVQANGHYISEYDNVLTDTAYRIIMPISDGIKGQVYSVKLIVAAYSHKEVLDKNQMASFVAYYVPFRLSANPSIISVTPYECRIPVDIGPGASYMAKVHAFELLPEALSGTADRLAGYPYYNTDVLADIEGVDTAIPYESRVMTASVIVELTGSTDMADVERRIVGVEIGYDEF